MRRKYKSGTVWGWWLWTDVDSEYITRLHIVKTPWFAICLHWINKPDAEPYLHDHPVTFLSIILKGWYGERRKYANDTEYGYRHIWYNYVRGSEEDSHRINQVSPGGAVTLCFMGPKKRDWMFHNVGPTKSKIGWKDYYAWKELHDAANKILKRDGKY